MILYVFQDLGEFLEIFNAEHFKRVLRADVQIVSSLPSEHLMSRQSIENQIPYDVTPNWIRARFYRVVRAEYNSWCAFLFLTNFIFLQPFHLLNSVNNFLLLFFFN
jgi:hypothetical protein